MARDRSDTQRNGDGLDSMDDVEDFYRDTQEDSFDEDFNSTEKDSYSRGSTEYEKHR
jgi:hypothetical protein